MKDRRLGKRPIWLPGLIIAYGMFLTLLTVLNWSGADRWWLGALNLYLPQAVWLAPVLLLTTFSIKSATRWIWVLGFYGAWVCGPIMGLCWNLHGHLAPASAGATIRFMTCNIKDSRRDVAALIQDLVRYEPDVVFLQDAGNPTDGPLGVYFRDWNICSNGQYVIASRWPLAKAEALLISQPKDQEYLLRTVVQIGRTPISLYNVHLLTPRDGLNALRAARKQPGQFAGAVQDLQDNVEHRILQAAKVSDFVRQEPGAIILAGDLNSPDESLVCKALREANLHDAFVEGGRGYGFTYGHFLLRGRIPWLPRISWMRIDHIMLSSRLQAKHCWTGTGEASDHRPVFADLTVPAS